MDSRVHQAGVETVRVGVDLLDMLMNLVGELVLARNQLLQASNSLQDAPLQSVSQRMNCQDHLRIDLMEAISVKKLSLKVKLAGGFGALLVALALMGFAAYSAIEKLSVLTDDISKQMQKKQYALDIDGGLELQTSSTRG
ncbi:MAG TPA: hypothetical protein VKB49_04575, partial [Candidatus Sulfotelmatobacter sp.]|nr:hypothetical protein [Candidatus Sulfotelmatobacter sp.]